MLTHEQIAEIRHLLHEAQNPLFFFHNDSDGLASFLLLRRFINRGNGVVVKSYPALNSAYMSKVNEFNPDFVFILDNPVVEKEFFSKVIEKGIKVVWIDHHPVPEKEIIQDIFYFNPLLTEPKDNLPVTYWCYKVSSKKEDIWIALTGCIGDWLIPDFYKEAYEKYPDLLPKNPKSAPEVLFSSEFGKIIKLLNLALKDKTTNVIRMLKYLCEETNPKELLEQTEKTKFMYARYNQISRKYTKLIEKGKILGKLKSKLLFFQYSGNLALSGELSNELMFYFPKKMIVVAFVKGEEAKLSIRGPFDVREITKNAIKKIEGARSGGHKNACAAMLNFNDLDKFKIDVLKQLKNTKNEK
jgi:single-stranded DNA-specific DHH superfamily exonuclease